MKGLKKVISLALCTVMAATVAGCGGKTDGKEIVLQWWYRGNGVQTDTQLVEDKFNEQLKTYEGMENVKVHLNCYPASDYKTSVTLAMSSGKQIDILNTVSMNFAQLCEDGVFISLDEYVNKNSALRETLPDWLWDMGKYDGEIKMVPNYQRATNMYYMLLPKEYADKFGKLDELRETVGQRTVDAEKVGALLEEYLLAVRKAYPNEHKYLSPLAKYFTKSDCFKDWGDNIVSNVNYFYETGKLENVYMTDKAKAAYKTTAEWFEKGYIHPDILSTDYYARFEMANMLNETSHVYSIAQGIGASEDIEKLYSAMYGFDVVALPVKDNYFITHEWAAGGNGVSISCKNPDKAMRLIELMTTEEGKDLYNLIVYGIEGKHYEKVNENTIKTLEYDTSQGGGSTSYAAMKWIMGNSFNAYLNQGCNSREIELSLEMNNSNETVKSNLIGFHAVTDEIETETAQINSLISEYGESLMYGVKGADWEKYYKEFEDKMKLAGIEKVVSTLKGQVNKFLK